MLSWRVLDGPVRGIGSAIERSVDAAGSADAAAYQAAATDLAGSPVQQTGLVLGALVRAVLEDQHAGGLDADDIRTVLSRCYQHAIAWLQAESVKIEPLVAVLSSSLGIHEAGVTHVEITGPPAPSRGSEWVDPERGSTAGASAASAPVADQVPTTLEYTWHAPLLIADMLRVGGRSLGHYLDRAFDEIAQGQTMELP